MADRGLPMCPEMILAVKDGRKWETRRMVKFPPFDATDDSLDVQYALGNLKPPYRVGDRLWFREGLVRKNNYFHAEGAAYYAADSRPVVVPSDRGDDERYYPWRWQRDFLPSIHMPKDCCRFWRDVTSVGLERVQEIDRGGCVREGITPNASYSWQYMLFRQLWDRLNAGRGYGWEANPWVWVVTWIERPSDVDK